MIVNLPPAGGGVNGEAAPTKRGHEHYASLWATHFAIDVAVPIWRLYLMSRILQKPRTRIPVRVSDEVRQALKQAAELLGATVNQFVVQTAYREAQRVIERKLVIRLTEKDAETIFALLDRPPKPNKRLRDAVKAYKGSVRA